MRQALAFVECAPAAAAARLDAGALHLWRLPHRRGAGRAALRRLLATYLGIGAEAVELVAGAHGRPALAPHLASLRGGLPLEFNASHSGDFALVALALGIAPGVDIERHHARANALALARRFFDADEAAVLERLDGDARDRAFLDLWCAKEAVLKAAGVGLSFGLSRLAFHHADAAWGLTRLDPALGAASDWQVTGFEPASSYHGALAWRGGARILEAFSAGQA